MRRMKLDTDRILSLTAMIVGVGSLVTLAYQAGLTRQSAHASMRPYLYIQLMANDQGVHLLLSNSGIGPALIDDVRIQYQGREIAADPYDFFTAQRPDLARLGVDVDKVLKGRLIPAGATIAMVGNSGSQKLLPDFLRLFEVAEVPRSWYKNLGVAGGDKAVIDITFESVYGDRWRVRSDRIVPDSL
jgi:hypothetical protein